MNLHIFSIDQQKQNTKSNMQEVKYKGQEATDKKQRPMDRSGIFYCLLLMLSLLIISCRQGRENATEEEIPSEQPHGKEEASIATLTQEQIKAVDIQLGKVENKELTATIKANGMLKVPNNNKGNATSLYGGVIKTLNVQIGDYVKKGQLIATIANPQFIQLQEEYLTIGSSITLAEQEVQRQTELNAGNAGALKNLQNATAERNTLRSRKASLERQIQLMGINPKAISNSNLQSALIVKSPLNGIVSNVFAKIGSYVDSSSPIAEMVDNSSLHLDLQIFEKDLPMLKVGQTIHFTLTNNPVKEYDATVFSIGSSFENDSKTIAVHCTVTGNKTELIDGMNITGIVSLNNVTAPAVPNGAIVNAENKDYIFIVTEKAEEQHQEEAKGEEQEVKDKGQLAKNNINFKKIEIVKGVSHMGYTAVTFVQDIPNDAQIVTKGAFFINAKLSNTGEHEH